MSKAKVSWKTLVVLLPMKLERAKVGELIGLPGKFEIILFFDVKMDFYKES